MGLVRSITCVGRIVRGYDDRGEQVFDTWSWRPGRVQIDESLSHIPLIIVAQESWY